LDEVINNHNLLKKEVISIDTEDAMNLPPTFGTAFYGDKQYFIATFNPDMKELHMKIYDLCKNNEEIKHVVLTKQQGI